MVDKWIEISPKDVIWANLDDSAYEVRGRYVTSWIATVILIVVWAFPVSK
jgi:calcium permeable stress-gated cation channel